MGKYEIFYSSMHESHMFYEDGKEVSSDYIQQQLTQKDERITELKKEWAYKIDRIGVYMKEIEQKDAIIKVLTEALEFYGDEETAYIANMCINKDYQETGGKRARQALEKVKGMG